MEFSLSLFTKVGIDPLTGEVIKAPVLGLTKSNIEIRKYDDPLTIYDYDNLGEIGDGEYVLWGINFSERPCRIYVNGVSQLWLGIVPLGEPSGVYAALASNNAYSGSNTHSGTNSYTTEKVLSDPKEFTYVKWVTNAITAAINLFKTAANSFTGINVFTGETYVENGTDDGHAVNLRQLTDAIATVSSSPFQESPNQVVVFPDCTVEPHKVYSNIATAINSFSGYADSRQFNVLIKGTGLSSKFIGLSHAALKDYIHISGVGKHINLILGYANASVSKKVRFQNLTIYMSASDIAEARTYTDIILDNCIVFAYHNTTFGNNVELINSKIYHAPGKSATLAGTCECLGTKFNQPITVAADTVICPDLVDGFNQTYSMPTDPLSV